MDARRQEVTWPLMQDGGRQAAMRPTRHHHHGHAGDRDVVNAMHLALTRHMRDVQDGVVDYEARGDPCPATLGGDCIRRGKSPFNTPYTANAK